MVSSQPLAGLSIWLARPAGQIKPWADVLQQQGATVHGQPLLEIVPPQDTATALQDLAWAEQANVVIGASPNAIRFAWRLRPQLELAGELCAVGAGTARKLQEHMGRDVAFPHHGDTSEDLLELPVLNNVQGKSIALLAGEGGRKKLVETLAARGANIKKVRLYRRQPMQLSQQRLHELLQQNQAIVLTSGSALENLCQQIQQNKLDASAASRLATIQLVVPSQRVANLVPAGLFSRPAKVMPQVKIAAVVDLLSCYTGEVHNF